MALIFSIIVLIMSVVIHEVSHGVVADKLGDPTARFAGRLTLNPLKHLDLFGSILLPLLLIIMRSPILIGWAKPVPYNPYNLKNPEKGAALIGAAGPVSNFAIAGVFSVLVRIFATGNAISLNNPASFADFLGIIVFINLLLGTFNLIPIPPLDGSKILFLKLSEFSKAKLYLQLYGMFFLLIFIFFFSNYLAIVVEWLFTLLTGLSLTLY